MAINAAQLRDLLRPGANTIITSYAQLPKQYSEIFEESTSDMNFEVDIETKLLGQGALRPEGTATEFQDMGERYSYRYTHVVYATGFVMTKIAIDDNLYKKQFNPNMGALKNAIRQTWENIGANVLNNANSSSFPGGDGVSLSSTAHPIDVGTYANTSSIQAQLSETSLQDAIVGIQRFRDPAGLTMMALPRKLVVTPEGQFTANRLLYTQGRVGTTDNDLNAIKKLDFFKTAPVVNFYLTDTNSWFVITDVPTGLRTFSRTPFEVTFHTDFTTDNLLTKASERRSFGWSNARGVWCQNP